MEEVGALAGFFFLSLLGFVNFTLQKK